MKFDLPTVLVFTLVAVLAVVFGNALRHDNVDTLSTGNICGFAAPGFAETASTVKTVFEYQGLNIELKGLFASRGICEPNQANFSIHITGFVNRSLPGLKNSWPFDIPELSDRLESELVSLLGEASQPRLEAVGIRLYQ